MKFGVSLGRIDDIDLAVQAEGFGYDFCWVWDSPLLRSNLWVVMALVAERTERIRVGSGVAIPGLRVAPSTANAIATINRLAPGRTFLGVGTGNTAMRSMGQLPMRVADYAEHLRVIKSLLHGDTVDYTANGRTHAVSFQSRELNYVDIEHPIPIHVGGFGPKSQALAGELGDGLITGIPRGGSIPDALANVQRGADQAGRTLEGFETTALVNMLLLNPDETLTSSRVLEEVGSSVMVNVHYLYDRFLEVGAEPSRFVESMWEEYVAFRRERDANRSVSDVHSSHYGHLDPEEARFVTPELIRECAIIGQPGDIVEQLTDLETQGLDGINFIPPVDQQYDIYARFASEVMQKM
ncbi:MAG: LLM class flavin-dependent oxidoreductase [Actinomycetota bacterium]|nr:LLM class flavin-dependent oxidoreductase [Actinomycetota bacterium]